MRGVFNLNMSYNNGNPISNENLPIRVLEILPSVNVGGGMESFIMNYFRNIDRKKIIFDFLVHDKSEPSYSQEIEKMGGKIFVLPSLSLNNIIKITKIYKEILRKEKYSIVHCNLANAAFIYLRVAQNMGVTTRILHSHQDKMSDVLIHAIRNIPLIAIGKKYANKNIACSKQAGDYLFRKKKYTVIRNGIDYEKYIYSTKKRNGIRKELGIENDTYVIGNTGRLTTQKNHVFLLELFYHFRLHKKNSKLLIVGGGENKDMLVSKAKKLGIYEDVIFTGVRKDINVILQAMDTFVFPSLYEGLGISLLEAQASGLKCYSSDRVPNDADISGNVVFLPLEVGPEKWVDCILKNEDKKSINRDVLLLDEKYNIKMCAEELEKYYLSMGKED